MDKTDCKGLTTAEIVSRANAAISKSRNAFWLASKNMELELRGVEGIYYDDATGMFTDDFDGDVEKATETNRFCAANFGELLECYECNSDALGIIYRCMEIAKQQGAKVR